jgi:hypothetical protein
LGADHLNEGLRKASQPPGQPSRNADGNTNVPLRRGRGVLREIAMEIGSRPNKDFPDRSNFEQIMWGVFECALAKEKWAVRELRSLVDPLKLDINLNAFVDDRRLELSSLTNADLLQRMDQLRALMAEATDDAPVIDVTPIKSEAEEAAK